MAVGWTTDHNPAPDKHVISIDILSDVVDLDFKTASVMFGDEVLLQPGGCAIGSPLAAPLAVVTAACYEHMNTAAVLNATRMLGSGCVDEWSFAYPSAGETGADAFEQHARISSLANEWPRLAMRYMDDVSSATPVPLSDRARECVRPVRAAMQSAYAHHAMTDERADVFVGIGMHEYAQRVNADGTCDHGQHQQTAAEPAHAHISKNAQHVHTNAHPCEIACLPQQRQYPAAMILDPRVANPNACRMIRARVQHGRGYPLRDTQIKRVASWVLRAVDTTNTRANAWETTAILMRELRGSGYSTTVPKKALYTVANRYPHLRFPLPLLFGLMGGGSLR